MRGAGGADPVDDVAAQDPEVGDHQVVGLAEDPAVHQPDQAAAEPAVAGGLLALEGAEDDVVALHGGVDQQRHLVGGVLPVVVHGDDEVAGGLAEPGEVGVVLAVVLQQVDRDHVVVRAGLLADDRPAVVGAAVVDEHDLVAQAALGEHGEHALHGLPRRAAALL